MKIQKWICRVFDFHHIVLPWLGDLAGSIILKTLDICNLHRTITMSYKQRRKQCRKYVCWCGMSPPWLGPRAT